MAIQGVTSKHKRVFDSSDITEYFKEGLSKNEVLPAGSIGHNNSLDSYSSIPSDLEKIALQNESGPDI
jgi:hypothetical protein